MYITILTAMVTLLVCANLAGLHESLAVMILKQMVHNVSLDKRDKELHRLLSLNTVYLHQFLYL